MPLISAKIARTALLASLGTVAAFGAVAIGSAAARLPHHQAAESLAVPLLACSVLAGASLMTAAASAAD